MARGRVGTRAATPSATSLAPTQVLREDPNSVLKLVPRASFEPLKLGEGDPLSSRRNRELIGLGDWPRLHACILQEEGLPPAVGSLAAPDAAEGVAAALAVHLEPLLDAYDEDADESDDDASDDAESDDDEDAAESDDDEDGRVPGLTAALEADEWRVAGRGRAARGG